MVGGERPVSGEGQSIRKQQPGASRQGRSLLLDAGLRHQGDGCRVFPSRKKKRDKGGSGTPSLHSAR